jgi:predicted ATPase/class 3 adenylate cyclase
MATEAHTGSPAFARPSGAITFLFSDIEGSTVRWERDRDAMAGALARHDALMRDAFEARGAYVFKTVGDAFCVAFAQPHEAIAAALDAQRALAVEDFSAVDGLSVRMALHSGTADERDGDYFGPAVNRVARLLAISHGGQILVSGTTADLVEARLPPNCSLRALGSHRLKDLGEPEHVFQLVAPQIIERFPALRSLEHMPNNLPQQLTSFVGRDEEVAEIRALMNEHRLVSLVGTGGAGKTRCAVQAGAEVLDAFIDGVWLIDLAPLSDPALVTAEIARALGVRAVPNHALLETLVAFLNQRQLLLLLDNCEHLIDEVRVVAAAILRACAGVRILATSRESLNIMGEQVFRLASLAVPPAKETLTAAAALSYAAVALFADRASASDSRFALTDENAPFVAEIVVRLDGIPLAIELAAARVKMLAPRQLALRLGERFRVLTGGDRSASQRQQTLRATVDWSYDLLEERERALFRRLAIFAGGWTLEAAANVCAGDGVVDEIDVLDSLGALVDKSLVSVEAVGDDGRYRMLFSIREYALERLRESVEEKELAGRHARFFAALVHNLVPLVAALEDEEWRQTLLPELDNLRAAIEWTVLKAHDSEIGLLLLADLEWPEFLTTPNEALRWFEAAGGLVDAMPNILVHARLLRRVAILDWLVGHPLAQREQTALRAVDLARATNDPNEIARALAALGGWYRSAGRFDEADRMFMEAYERPELLSRFTTRLVLRGWSVTALQRGQLDLARQLFWEAVRLERPGSEAHAGALLDLGELEFVAGDVKGAREAAYGAKETYTRLNSVYLVLLLSNLAAYAIAAGDLEEARRHLREALALQRRTGSGWLATVLELHALLAAVLGDHERAARLVGFTGAYYVSRGKVREFREAQEYDRLMGLLGDAYPADELAQRMREGAALADEQALADAAAIHIAADS